MNLKTEERRSWYNFLEFSEYQDFDSEIQINFFSKCNASLSDLDGIEKDPENIVKTWVWRSRYI